MGARESACDSRPYNSEESIERINRLLFISWRLIV